MLVQSSRIPQPLPYHAVLLQKYFEPPAGFAYEHRIPRFCVSRVTEIDDEPEGHDDLFKKSLGSLLSSAFLPSERDQVSAAHIPDAPYTTLMICYLGIVCIPLLPLDARRIIQLIEKEVVLGERDAIEAQNKSWHIPGFDVQPLNKAWSSYVNGKLKTRVCKELGVDEEKTYVRLHSLLLDCEGGQLDHHTSNGRDPSVFGSLIVILPCQFTGGAIQYISRDGSRAFETSPHSTSSTSFVSFHKTNPPRILPVESGYRLALLYSLILKTVPSSSSENGRSQNMHFMDQASRIYHPHDTSMARAPDLEEPKKKLRRMLTAWIKTVNENRGDQNSNKSVSSNCLVHVMGTLDSQSSLSFSSIRDPSDLLKIDFLRQLSTELGFSLHIAQLDVCIWGPRVDNTSGAEILYETGRKFTISAVVAHDESKLPLPQLEIAQSDIVPQFELNSTEPHTSSLVEGGLVKYGFICTVLLISHQNFYRRLILGGNAANAAQVLAELIAEYEKDQTSTETCVELLQTIESIYVDRNTLPIIMQGIIVLRDVRLLTTFMTANRKIMNDLDAKHWIEIIRAFGVEPCSSVLDGMVKEMVSNGGRVMKKLSQPTGTSTLIRDVLQVSTKAKRLFEMLINLQEAIPSNILLQTWTTEWMWKLLSSGQPEEAEVLAHLPRMMGKVGDLDIEELLTSLLQSMTGPGEHRSRQCETIKWIVSRVPGKTPAIVRRWAEESIFTAYSGDDIEDAGMVDEVVALTREYGFDKTSILLMHLIQNRENTAACYVVFPPRLDFLCKLLAHFTNVSDRKGHSWCDHSIRHLAIYQQSYESTIAMISQTIRMLDACQTYSPHLVRDILNEQERHPWPGNHLGRHIPKFAAALRSMLEKRNLSFADSPYDAFARRCLIAAIELWKIPPPRIPPSRKLKIDTKTGDQTLDLFLEADYAHILRIKRGSAERLAVFEKALDDTVKEGLLSVQLPPMLSKAIVYQPVLLIRKCAPVELQEWDGMLSSTQRAEMMDAVKSCGLNDCLLCQAPRACIGWHGPLGSISSFAEAFGAEAVKRIFAGAENILTSLGISENKSPGGEGGSGAGSTSAISSGGGSSQTSMGVGAKTTDPRIGDKRKVECIEISDSDE